MVTAKPATVRVRAYQVGFGDCLLVTVGYNQALPDGRRERHILVDFGTKVRAAGGPTLAAVAAKIAEHCGGQLDVVVVTHRHQDHVRGFGDQVARQHLDPLQPNLIIRPWTDAPEPARDAPGNDLGPESRSFLGLLDTIAGHDHTVRAQFNVDDRVFAKRAKQLAELGVSNAQALSMLELWVPAERTRWVRAGDLVEVDELLPGVSVEVLGPPTLEQVPGMKSYASSSAEYWLGLAADGGLAPELVAGADRDGLRAAKEAVAGPGGLGRPSWLLDKLHTEGPRQVLDIVEGFDDVLNNTSVVLLVTVGRRSLLLSGDAQVENWSYTLDRALGTSGRDEDLTLRRRLARVDLYKVGHHGSRNATPKRLYDLWKGERRSPLCSVVSTQEGVYGTTAEGKVPKQELLAALREVGELHSTEDLDKNVWWFDVEASATARSAAFRYQAGPAQG
ncbi:MAG: hypothetical protein QM619_13760 [Micropruina sp.]|uniref:hypothetical protein n=1 Tax=Micropruina sp. TaxID=2737536 RepID=UPI0039E22AE1